MIAVRPTAMILLYKWWLVSLSLVMLVRSEAFYCFMHCLLFVKSKVKAHPLTCTTPINRKTLQIKKKFFVYHCLLPPHYVTLKSSVCKLSFQIFAKLTILIASVITVLIYSILYNAINFVAICLYIHLYVWRYPF